MDLLDLIQQAVVLIAVAVLMGLMIIGMLHLMGVSIKPAQTAKVVFTVYEDNGTYHLEERYEYARISPAEREILFKALKEDVEKREQYNTFPSLVDKLPFKHYISII